jgi:hypothetical protein
MGAYSSVGLDTTPSLCPTRRTAWVLQMQRGTFGLGSSVASRRSSELHSYSHWQQLEQCRVCGRLLDKTDGNFAEEVSGGRVSYTHRSCSPTRTSAGRNGLVANPGIEADHA